MSLYNKILVTLDCSEVDEVIIQHILILSKVHQSQVDLLHIVHSHTLDQKQFMTEKATVVMQTYQSLFQQKGIKCTSIIRMGEPEIEIFNVINNEKYDLIAMATHGHHFLGDLLYGSVSDSLKHKINVPILLIKGKHIPKLEK